MPSKNMLRKGKRRQTVKAEYRVHRDAQRETEQKLAEETRAAEEAQAAAAAEQTRTARHQRAAGKTGSLQAAPVAPEPAQQPSITAVATPAEESETDDAGIAFFAEETPSASEGLRTLVASPQLAGKRLDAALAAAMPEISRGRVQLLIENGQVRVDGKAAKASLKLTGGERIEIEGEPRPAPLRAEPEDIPLTIVHEDQDLAVIDKPAGMLVHAGAGDAAHNRGTLVNALLFHFQKHLSREGGALRPGIVHRLDKDTSGLILVAKNDATHQRLAAMFQEHDLEKTYLALVHGWFKDDEGTVNLPVGRDPVRRTRMTTRRSVEAGARPAVSHWRVLERIGARDIPGPWGVFTLVEVAIETGRTHQIRVHLASLGHPVVGDTLYGAPGVLRPATMGKSDAEPRPTLERNFLHASELRLLHPRTGRELHLQAALPVELVDFLDSVRPIDEADIAPPRQRSARVAKIQAK